MARKQTRKQAQKREEPPPSGRELVQNLRQMIDEAEEMIVRAASHQVDEKVDELRMQLEEKLDRLKANYRQAEERVVDLAGAADSAIRQKPYQSLLVATGLGMILGLWLNRRR